MSGIERADESGPLGRYRFYFFDGAGRIACTPYEFEAVSNDAAMRVAEGWREGRSMELWSGHRKSALLGRRQGT